MPRLYLFVLITLCCASCKSALMVPSYALGAPPAKKTPFVQLRNNERIEAGSVNEKPDSITADHKSYPKRDVAFFGDGATTFCNLNNRKFATELQEGDISLYGSCTPFKTRYGRISSICTTYVQKAGSDQLHLFTYHSVKKMIVPGDPGYDYLKRYRKNRAWWNLGFYGGFAVELAGVGFTSGNNPSGQVIGNSLMLAGLSSLLTSVVEVELNKRRNVQKAIAKHNHMIE